MLQTRQPSLVMQAIARILQGSGPRAVATLIVLALALTLAWIVLASLGRGATLKALFEDFQEGDQSGSAKLAIRLAHGTEFLTRRITACRPHRRGWRHSFGRRSLLENEPIAGDRAADLPDANDVHRPCLVDVEFVSVAGRDFRSRQARDWLGALAATVDLFRSRPGAVAAVNIWFGIAHGIAFFIAVTAAAVPMGLGQVLPAGIVFGGVLLVILIYLAIADFLYVGRLAAYVFMTVVPQSMHQPPVSIEPPVPASDDDILSDIPGLVPPPHPAAG